MPKNTGRGSRSAQENVASKATPEDKVSTWIKSGYRTGLFLEAKTRGGSFKGLK
jgi:hypothetical protein